MKCPHCQADNREGHRFCGECGAPLVLTCHSCGFANEPGKKFCGGCGGPLAPAAPAQARFASPHSYTPTHLAEKILTSRAALEGERKLVTVLFVDVSGFTALSEKLDPEVVHQVMDRAFELMLGEIHRYEGTVNQFLGDGLMALFGAPVAHEDHPLHAVHAALGIGRALAGYRDRLREERGLDFQVRMGLNTGGVVVGKIGDNLRMDYTAVGDTTNLAARLLALAEPGHILIGEDTAKAVAAYVVLQPLGEIAVKGKALPVRAHRLEGSRPVRSRLEAESERGLTPLVGRQRELALLQERLDEIREGHGQVVLVAGEAGIGKSRLLLEFRRRAESAGARWVLGRCVSFGRSISYLPVLDFIRDLLDIKEGDSAETMLDKVERGVQDAGAAVAWTGPLLRALLSLDPGDPAVAGMNPAQRRGRTAEAVRALLIQASLQRPLVLVVEDLHWIDPHSEEVLRAVLDGMAAAPLTVILTYRPGYAHPFGEQTYYTRITLHALPRSQTAHMVDRVLDKGDVPPEVRQLIADKAEGNPLFIEEMAKSLVEDGTLARLNGGYRLTRPVGEIAIPNTIQGVIMARIDRLPEPSKNALQVASVIGREFTARLVERVAALERAAGQALGELRAVELIYEKATYPELAYMFKHALTHDVAYESLLRSRRRELHRRAGEVIEELYPDRLAEFYETLAWHFTHGEAWHKAADYLLKAADKARGHFDYVGGVHHCEEALEILERHRGPAGAIGEAFERIGDLQSLLGSLEPANQAYEQALARASESEARRRITNKRHVPASVVRDGARIVYYEHGTGTPTLVFVHPLVYGIGSFQPIVEIVCQELKVITLDPRGTGRSDPLPGTYLIADHVEDLRAVIEAAGDGPVVLIGNSAGATVAATFAATYPALVERLVLAASSPAPPSVWEPPYPAGVTPGLRDAVEAGDYEGALRLFFPRALSEPGTGHIVEQAVGSWRELAPETIRNFWRRADPGRDLRPLLPTLRMPTLVLHGERDVLQHVEAGRWVAEHIPNARFHVLEGRCHAAWVTAPGQFVAQIRDFVRQRIPS